jgi:hypothetical protein
MVHVVVLLCIGRAVTLAPGKLLDESMSNYFCYCVCYCAFKEFAKESSINFSTLHGNEAKM